MVFSSPPGDMELFVMNNKTVVVKSLLLFFLISNLFNSFTVLVLRKEMAVVV
jgi:hypothetical protein